MGHSTAGKITDNLWYLGREESGVYLLEGRNGSILINGGLAHILPDVLKQMKEFGIDPAKITKILILHSHFDHIGVIPYFKRNCPAIEFCGSAETWRILQMQKAIDIANQFSKIVADKMGLGAALEDVDFAWRDDITGKTVAEGDRIDMGGTALNVLYTPGHTNCSITAYEPDRKALFASDGGGIPYRDGSFASANTNEKVVGQPRQRNIPGDRRRAEIHSGAAELAVQELEPLERGAGLQGCGRRRNLPGW